MSVRLATIALRGADALRELGGPAEGGVALFEGRVRADRRGGQVVVALEYEADRPFALRMMKALERTAKQRFGVSRTVLWHRVGTVPVGEAAVIVGAAAGHRAAAFAAAQFLIDQLKRDVPLWKADRVRRAHRRPPPRRPGGARSSG